jgi:collagenase-like PrtC family protease
VDALIISDLGGLELAKRHAPRVARHVSTQFGVINSATANALYALGADTVVLARETPLEDIRKIRANTPEELRIEAFVHGAMCVSFSGRCLLSNYLTGRDANRGQCAQPCRWKYHLVEETRPGQYFEISEDGGTFIMNSRDMRMIEHLPELLEAGVTSLKIEGRMKSALYVASAVKHYRDILDGAPETTTRADLETVFSRRTTPLYIHGHPDPRRPAPPDPPVIDPSALGHLGTPIGTVKRITRDREGRAWIRFHTNRALEKHDGLQFAQDGGKPFGFGITEMRTALSRRNCFSVPADTDVEILLPDSADQSLPPSLGEVFCSASNEMKRRFPIPSFRPAELSPGVPVDFTLSLAEDGISATAAPARAGWNPASVSIPGHLEKARDPSATPAAARKAFSKLGGTRWSFSGISVEDPHGLFAPPALLKDARRRLVAALDAALDESRAARIAAALAPSSDNANPSNLNLGPLRAEANRSNLNLPPSRGEVLKLRLDQPLPPDAADFAEIVVAIGHLPGREVEAALASRFASCAGRIRLALPVFTHEADFNALRSAVKHLMRAGFAKWEASDLAALRLLRALGATDITADWPLYSFNRAARALLAEMGVARTVVSPEMSAAAVAPLPVTTGAPHVEFLVRQSTPLFISLTRPAAEDPSRLTGLDGDSFTCYFSDGLWTTIRTEPRAFPRPSGDGVILRTDLSWDAPSV